MGRDRELRSGEKGGREKSQPSKKKDREMKRKQASVTDYKDRKIEAKFC